MSVVALALALTSPRVPAADRHVAQPLDVGPFTAIDVNGNVEINLVQGDREAVVVTAPPTTRARLRVRSSDGRLTIDTNQDKRGWWQRSEGRPTIDIHFRTLDTLRTSGAVRVRAATLKAPSLRVKASGATTMKLDALDVAALRFTGSGAVKSDIAGRANEQEVVLSGAGTYRARDLASSTVSVSVSGAGNVVVQARDKLDATISGAGAIDYYGDPQVTRRVSGAGKIRQRSSTTTKPTSA
ncbi:MAG TPA: head GIN domain-containing protein [Casimicrobiaceae bacterium]|nr:head GIN domain-containing protein [Casimicrobiaceae bacterium]